MKIKSIKERDIKIPTFQDSIYVSELKRDFNTYIDEEMAETARSIWYNNGATMIPLYVTVMHRKQDNGLDFVFEYRKEPESEYDLRVLYNKMNMALVMGAENPDITVGEILEKIALTDAERNGKKECKNSKNLLDSLKTTWKLTKSRLKTVLTLLSA